MKYYLVKYLYIDLNGLNEELIPHLTYIKDLLKKGYLIMAEPIESKVEDLKETLLLFAVEDEDELKNLMKLDPYWKHELIEDYDICKWDPKFGKIGCSHREIERYIDRKKYNSL